MSLQSFKALSLFVLFSLGLGAQSGQVTNPYLETENHLFTSRLTYGDQTFTGYLGVKYSSPYNYRISFTTGMGSTLLDLEWKDGGFIRHYIPENLDRRIIINKLRADFEMMFLHTLSEGKWKDEHTLKVGCHKHRFTFSESKLPLTIEDHSWLGGLKRTITLGYSSEDHIQTVSLKHHSFALQIQLTTIE